ncbi:MAG: hypothetical protein ACLUMK_08625 [Christensenellales bacterium]
MKNDFSEIQSEIDAMQPDLVRIRRDLHRHPETGWLEMRTTAILAKALRTMGYETYTGARSAEGARLGCRERFGGARAGACAGRAGGRADGRRSRGLHGRDRDSAMRRGAHGRDAV